MSDCPESPFPKLHGTVKKEDVFKKGANADYITWARIATYLQEEAPGWQLQMRPDATGSHVWLAPNNSGYLVVYFRGPGGVETTDFPYALTDHQNKAIAWEQITATVIANSHRRALCAASAFFFGLGAELWSREEIEGSTQEPAPEAPILKSVPTPAQAQEKTFKKKEPREEKAPSIAEVPEGERPMDEAERKALIGDLMAIRDADNDLFNAMAESFLQRFTSVKPPFTRNSVQTKEHNDFIQSYLQNRQAA